MSLIATGLNHRSAHIDLRERCAFSASGLPDALRDLLAQPQVEEGMIVSTCNRTEIYAVGDDAGALRQWVAQHRGIEPQEFLQHSYIKTDRDAALHAMRVACGLDSQVLGEPQILGQIKSAWRDARDQGALGPVLTRLFQQAFGTAKIVRSETALGAGQVSVAACAARIAAEIFGDLRGKDVLLIGAGETAELMARYLGDMGQPRLTIANRSQERAQALATSIKAATCSLDTLPQFLGVADVIVGCVATLKPIVQATELRQAFKSRKRKPVLMLDLGVPRNFEVAVAQDEDVFLYGIDDLQSRVSEGEDNRRGAAAVAEKIVGERSAEFEHWLRGRGLDLGLQTLEAHWRDELAALHAGALKKIAAGGDAAEILERLQHTALQRLLHMPRKRLRELPVEQQGRVLVELERLFDLPDDADPTR